MGYRLSYLITRYVIKWNILTSELWTFIYSLVTEGGVNTYGVRFNKI